MRGGRNKFGPMYKRDRARKLQVMRNRQHVVSGPLGGLVYPGSNGGTSGSNTPATPASNPTIYTPQLPHIKQEIQIPQVTSMTSSPDSSPSPVLNPQHQLPIASHPQIIVQQTDSTGTPQWQISTSPNSGNRVSATQNTKIGLKMGNLDPKWEILD